MVTASELALPLVKRDVCATVVWDSSIATAVRFPASQGTDGHSPYEPAPATIVVIDRVPWDLPLTKSSTAGAEEYACTARVLLPKVEGNESGLWQRGSIKSPRQ